MGTLESRLGVSLFQRSNRGMQLTTAGKFMLERAREIVDLSNRSIAQARLMQQGDMDELVIANEMIIHNVLYDLVDDYTRRFPGRHVS